MALTSLLVGLIALTAAPARAQSAARGILVELKEHARVSDLNRAHHSRLLYSFPGRNLHLLRNTAGSTQESLLAELNRDPNVKKAEPDVPVQATRLYFSKDGTAGVYLNPYYMDQVDYGPATQTLTGAGIIVAVLDTGADFTHPALVGHLIQGYDFINNSPNAFDLPDEPAGSTDPNYNCALGHGTFNAGLVAMLAPQAQIMPLRVINAEGIGYLSNVLAALWWAVNNHASVINMSFGTPTYSCILGEAVEEVQANGILVVASAGNTPNGQSHYPASYPNVIAVTSLNGSDVLSSFSNFGSFVSVSAPGEGIRSTFWDGTYAIGNGTSFAAPFATGLAALLLSAPSVPDPETVQQTILGTTCSVDLLNPGFAGLIGTGVLDFDNAILSLPE